MGNMNKRKILCGTILGGLALCLEDSAAMEVKPYYGKLTHAVWVEMMEKEAGQTEKIYENGKKYLRKEELKKYKRIEARADEIFPKSRGMRTKLCLALECAARDESILESKISVRELKARVAAAARHGGERRTLFIVQTLFGMGVKKGDEIWTYMETLLGRTGEPYSVKEDYVGSSDRARWTIEMNEKNKVVSGGMLCSAKKCGRGGLLIEISIVSALRLRARCSKSQGIVHLDAGGTGPSLYVRGMVYRDEDLRALLARFKNERRTWMEQNLTLSSSNSFSSYVPSLFSSSSSSSSSFMPYQYFPSSSSSSSSPSANTLSSSSSSVSSSSPSAIKVNSFPSSGSSNSPSANSDSSSSLSELNADAGRFVPEVKMGVKEGESNKISSSSSSSSGLVKEGKDSPFLPSNSSFSSDGKNNESYVSPSDSSFSLLKDGTTSPFPLTNIFQRSASADPGLSPFSLTNTFQRSASEPPELSPFSLTNTFQRSAGEPPELEDVSLSNDLGRITPNSLSSDIDFEGIHLQLNTNE